MRAHLARFAAVFTVWILDRIRDNEGRASTGGCWHRDVPAPSHVSIIKTYTKKPTKPTFALHTKRDFGIA